jgi:hypothetical protein
MQRVSIRTLVLLLELQAGAVWVATDFVAPADQVDSPLGL